MALKHKIQPGDSKMKVAAYGTYMDLETGLQSGPGDSVRASQMEPALLDS